MSNTNNMKVMSLDGTEQQPASSSSSPAALTDPDSSPIPCVEVSSDFEAVYRQRCAGILSRAQPATVSLKSAIKWVSETPKIKFTFPSTDDPDNSTTPSARLHRLKILEDAEANEVVEFTAYPYLLELLSVVAGTGDLPEGYDPRLALFTAVYLALPAEIVARLCEDWLWGLGGDRAAFYDVFKTRGYWLDLKGNNHYYYSTITLIDTPIAEDVPNRQYGMVAREALKEYLKRNEPYKRSFSRNPSELLPYMLSIRFLESVHKSSDDETKDETDAKIKEAEMGNIAATVVQKLQSGDPRMLHYIFTKQSNLTEFKFWPNPNFKSEEYAETFTEMLCAYITSKCAWRSTLAKPVISALLDQMQTAPYFEIVNIVFSHLVASGINIKFNSTRLLTASVSHSEESFLACRNFVKRAEIFTKISPTGELNRVRDMVKLQCRLLECDMLHHSEDAQLQEFMLKNLEMSVSSYADGFYVVTVSELIARVFIKGRIGVIRRLHNLGLNIGYMRDQIYSYFIKYIPISVSEFIKERGWFESGGVEYRKNFMRTLTRSGSHHAIRWMCDKYPCTCDELWSAFCDAGYLYREDYFYTYVHSPEENARAQCMDHKKGFRKIIHWLLQQNRLHWRREIPQRLIPAVIAVGDYVTLRALYLHGEQKLQPAHVSAILKFNDDMHNTGIYSNSRPVHKNMLFGMLRCMWDVLRASKTRLNQSSIAFNSENGNLQIIAWMVHRGFFNETREEQAPM
jgi:hypothetical protein